MAGHTIDAPDRRRRLALAALGSAPLWVRAQAAPGAAPAPANALVDTLRAGGVVVMLRHATTDPGVGDPPGFKPGVCSTQRNLSAAGRAEAMRIGAWFKRHQLEPAAVRSSAWCRCIDTAQLAFGRHLPWPAIDSSFSAGDGAERLPLIGTALRGLEPGRFEVWVTHQTNITSATGSYLAMGHAVVVKAAASGDRPAQVLGTLSFEP